MNCRIRTLTIADYEPVLRLWQETEGIGLNESDDRGHVRSYLRRNPGMSFVARHGAEIVGAVLCGHDGRRGYLHHLAVAKAHRKKGLGKKLVNACLAKLRRLKIQKCNIFLFADNAAGEAFWKHNGWIERSDLLVMQKKLGAVKKQTRMLTARRLLETSRAGGGGVRPSRAQQWQKANRLAYFGYARIPCAAAPEDGRTPGNF